MDFYVTESPSFDVMVCFPALEALLRCLAFGLQQVTPMSGSKWETLLFEYAIVEVSVDDSLERNSKDFTSDSDAAPDADEDCEEDFVVVLVYNLLSWSDYYSAPNFFGSDQKASAVENRWAVSINILKGPSFFYWRLRM